MSRTEAWRGRDGPVRRQVLKGLALGLACILALAGIAPFAAAQGLKRTAAPEAPALPMPILPPGPSETGAAALPPLPYAPPAVPLPAGPTPPASAKPTLSLAAQLTPDGAPVRSGLVWRVFSQSDTEGGRLALVATATGGDADFRVEPGTYVVHAGYGRAGATAKVQVGNGVRREVLVLNAGGLKLAAAAAPEVLLPTDSVSFDVFSAVPDANGERQPIALGARADRIVRLKADRYHVVSRYGDLNAVVRAEIEVQAGKLTEATLYHKAATLTLKLVAERGGEALPNVEWTILAADGRAITRDSVVGAFPKVTLAEGGYSVVAKYQGRSFSRPFTVQAAQDGEIEVVAEDPQR